MSDDSNKARSLEGPQGGAPQQPEPRSTIPALVLFPSEDRDDYETFHEDLWEELGPEGVQQRAVANRIIALTWRLQNLRVFRDAQDARQKFQPFLRETILETLVAYSDFCTKITHEQIEAILKRKAASADQNAEKQANSENMKDGEQTISLFDPQLMQEISSSFQVLMETAKNVFGSDAMTDIEDARKNGLSIELAFFADVLTVENYLNELKLAAEIERAIDQNRERLWKLKEEKRKSGESSKTKSRLLPPYD